MAQTEQIAMLQAAVAMLLARSPAGPAPAAVAADSTYGLPSGVSEENVYVTP